MGEGCDSASRGPLESGDGTGWLGCVDSVKIVNATIKAGWVIGLREIASRSLLILLEFYPDKNWRNSLNRPPPTNSRRLIRCGIEMMCCRNPRWNTCTRVNTEPGRF